MVYTDFVDFGGEAVDEPAFRELEILFEILHDININIMTSVDEGLREFAETRGAGFGRPFTGELGIFRSAEVEVLLVEARSVLRPASGKQAYLLFIF